MGGTYGNVTLRGVPIERVAAELRSFERTAFLLADGDNVAVFMPEADEDPLQVAGNLSVATGGAAALAVLVVDSDLLVTWLVVDGEIRDRYVSDAALVDDGDEAHGDDGEQGAGAPAGASLGAAETEHEPDEPVARPDGGDAAELCAAFGGDPAVVEGLLRGTVAVADPTFPAESLHAALVDALGLPLATLGVGFGHLEEGIELPPDDQARLVRVG
jgi:hypothetical protein